MEYNDREDGRLMSQNSHLVRGPDARFFYRAERAIKDIFLQISPGMANLRKGCVNFFKLL